MGKIQDNFKLGKSQFFIVIFQHYILPESDNARSKQSESTGHKITILLHHEMPISYVNNKRTTKNLSVSELITNLNGWGWDTTQNIIGYYNGIHGINLSLS